MQLDKQGLFSDGQAITATAASTNYIDLGAPGTPAGSAVAIPRDLGKGEPLPLLVNVDEAFNNLTSITIALQVDDDEAFGSAKTVQSATVALADLAGGRVPAFDYVPNGADERYMRLHYTVTGTAPTTGKITAGFVAAHDEAWPR